MLQYYIIYYNIIVSIIYNICSAVTGRYVVVSLPDERSFAEFDVIFACHSAFRPRTRTLRLAVLLSGFVDGTTAKMSDDGPSAKRWEARARVEYPLHYLIWLREHKLLEEKLDAIQADVDIAFTDQVKYSIVTDVYWFSKVP